MAIAWVAISNGAAVAPAEGVRPGFRNDVTRAAAQAANDAVRYEVLTDVDVEDAARSEGALSGGADEAPLRKARRLHIILALSTVGGQLALAVTLRDTSIDDGGYLHRAVITAPSEAALLVALRPAVIEALTHFVDHPKEGRTKLWISRPSIDAPAPAESTPTQAPMPAPPSGPSPLVIGGGVVGGLGVVGVVVGGIVGLGANGVIGSETSTTKEKDDAAPARTIGYVGAGVGVVVAAVGGGLLAVGLGAE